jgi:hypothetical protein
MNMKIVYCLTRKAHLSREQFQEYWLNIHAPKVQAVQHLIGMTRYVQSHTVENEMSRALQMSRGGAEPYDGIMEGWFETTNRPETVAEDYIQAARMLLDDEGRFIDFERSRIFITREHVIFQ